MAKKPSKDPQNTEKGAAGWKSLLNRPNPDYEPIDYEERLKRHRIRQLLKLLLILLVIAAVISAVFLYITRRTYRNFRILESREQEDIVSTKYAEMDGSILRYSSEEVSLVNSNMDTMWSVTYSMQNPVADVRGSKAVIADKDGTSLKMFDKNGLTGSTDTSYSIVKAKVSNKGMVAAILDGGDDTWINFYAPDGSLIAENQTKIDDPGYPMDVSISDDGVIMMVTYQYVQGGKVTSYVAFYNFGDVGQNEDDRIVSGYTYEDVVIPQVSYMGGSVSAAVREDGITLYQGKQIPKEMTTVRVDQEIVSTFMDDNAIGLVFKNDNADKVYTMEVYGTSGKLKFKKDFNIPYTTIRISKGYILMFNSSQLCVMNEKGETRYAGNVDGAIRNFFRLGFNKYLLVLDSGINIIKFT